MRHFFFFFGGDLHTYFWAEIHFVHKDQNVSIQFKVNTKVIKCDAFKGIKCARNLATSVIITIFLSIIISTLSFSLLCIF